MKTINVALATDKNYCQHAAVTVASLLENNRNHLFSIFIAATESLGPLTEALKETISQFDNASVDILNFAGKLPSGLHLSHHISQAAYARLLLPTRLPLSAGRLIYLDSDIVVCQDISPLWNADLGGMGIGAVTDLPKDHSNIEFSENDPYFNSGMLVIDVEKWRRDNVEEDLMRYAVSRGPQLTYWDQDVLNACFKDRVMFLNLKWNFQAAMSERPEHLGLSPSHFRALRKNPAIVHWTSQKKPWNYMDEVQYAHLYYRYLALTPFRSYRPRDKHLRNFVPKLYELTKRKVKWMFPSAPIRLD